MRLSVLDLGSNSFHVLIADVGADGDVVPVGREREMLHLGATVQRRGEIPATDVQRAVDVVTHLTELVRRLGADRRLAVGTSALRDARNGPAVVAALSDAAGAPVRVIDGETEARLAYAGVRASVGVPAEPLLVLDLGGGSLELAIGTGSDVAWTATADLGVSRLSALVDHDPPTDDELRHLRDLVRTTLAPLRAEVRRLAPAATVAVGGTIRALARVVAAEEHTWLPATLNQYTIPAGEIIGLRDRLVRLDTEERAGLPGMKSKRADRIHVAAVVLAAALDVFDLEQFTVSDWGLREGALLDDLGLRVAPGPAELRARSVARMRRTFVPDDPDLPDVAHLVLQLFDGTRGLHHLDDHDRGLLHDGAALHDIGESLALRRHHHHGAYLLQHAELRGYSPGDTALLCTMVRFHTSRGLSLDYPPYAALRKQNRRRAEELVALLQVALGLARARDPGAPTIDVHHDGTRVDVALHGGRLHISRAELDRKAQLFERVFGLPIHIQDLE
jgi:exopolyphosphatase / guanosine-5'-triphosphate,3'-diphosphate pyrophosphatase